MALLGVGFALVGQPGLGKMLACGQVRQGLLKRFSVFLGKASRDSRDSRVFFCKSQVGSHRSGEGEERHCEDVFLFFPKILAGFVFLVFFLVLAPPKQPFGDICLQSFLGFLSNS